MDRREFFILSSSLTLSAIFPSNGHNPKDREKDTANLLKAIDRALMEANRQDNHPVIEVLFVLRGALLRGECAEMARVCGEFAQKMMRIEAGGDQ